MSEPSDAGRLKSPPFPAIPLQRAIERAEQLYRIERDHLVPIASAARAWGMSPTSSSPIQAVGALRQYNLIVDDGAGAARKIRLTNDALRIVLDKQPDSRDRDEAIRRCFLSPKTFAELWEKWGNDLPSEQTMLNHLILERKLAGLAPFSEMGAIELLGNYRASMAFSPPSEEHNAPAASKAAGKEDEQMSNQSTTEYETGPSRPTAPHPQSLPRPAADLGAAQDERVVFVEEGTPGQRVKLVASGDLDEFMLDALEDYIKRQKRRLARTEALN